MMLVVLLLGGCGGRAGEWPAAELAKLRSECEVVTDPATAATAAMERATCHCLYDRLPAKVRWEEFVAWRESPGHEGAARDPEMTKRVAEVSAECAVEAVDPR